MKTNQQASKDWKIQGLKMQQEIFTRAEAFEGSPKILRILQYNPHMEVPNIFESLHRVYR